MGDALTCGRFPIPDLGICTSERMNEILDAIDEHLAAGRTAYVHCWGGAGRTGMVVGCWLVRHGRTGVEALAEVDRLFRTMPKATTSRMHRELGSPQTDAQRAMVRGWEFVDRVRVAPSPRRT